MAGLYIEELRAELWEAVKTFRLPGPLTAHGWRVALLIIFILGFGGGFAFTKWLESLLRAAQGG